MTIPSASLTGLVIAVTLLGGGLLIVLGGMALWTLSELIWGKR